MPTTVTIEGRTFGLGAKPSPKDIRDYTLAEHRPDLLSMGIGLPPLVDLRLAMPPIEDQGPEGSCTAFGSGSTHEAIQKKQSLAVMKGSKAAQYYWTRQLEGTQNYDSGAYVRDALKVLGSIGYAPDADFPYQAGNYYTPPPPKAQTDAAFHKATKYISVPNDVNQIKTVLAAGYPVVIGFTVYNNFFNPQPPNYIIPSPAAGIAGGHCVSLVGYDDALSAYLFRNSWGTGWGMGGYARLTYNYLSMLGSDFWMISEVAGGSPPPPPPPPPSPVTVLNVSTTVRFTDGTSKTVTAYP